MGTAGAGVALFLLFVAGSVGLGLVLYALVRAEATDRAVVSREAAERLARRDTDDDE